MSSVLYIHATSSNAPIWELHLRMSITADSVLSNQMEPYYSFYQPHGGPRCGSTVKPWIARNLFYEGSARGSNVSNKFNPDKQAMSCDTRRMRCHMITTEPMVLLSLSLSLSLSHCGIVGDCLPCLDARSQAVVFGRNPWFFSTLEGARNRHSCIFCHFQAPVDSPLLLHPRVSLGTLCSFQVRLPADRDPFLCCLIASYIR